MEFAQAGRVSAPPLSRALEARPPPASSRTGPVAAGATEPLATVAEPLATVAEPLARAARRTRRPRTGARGALRSVLVLSAVVVTVLAGIAPGLARADAPDPPPRPPGAGIRAPGADYAWPLHPAPAVGAPFRRPTFRFGTGHRGADLTGTAGQAVLAAREGVVVFAGPVAGRGVVSVDHPDGLRTTYEPVRPTVAAGAAVTAGGPLGVLEPGHAGCPVAACLHWGVRRGKIEYLDPLVLVRPARLRLLPWEGLVP